MAETKHDATQPVAKKMSFADRVNKLTTGEMKKVQEITGRPWSDEESYKYIEYLQALTYVWKRRENREFQFVEVEIMTVSEISDYLGAGETDDEDEAESENDPFVAGQKSE